jgi:uncharacterized protein YraI
LAFVLAVIVTLTGTVSRTSAAPGTAGPAVATANRSCDPCPAITTDRLNLRKGPGTSYKVIVVIPANTEVLAYYNSEKNGYLKVEYGDATGWAHGDYLRSPDAPNWIGLAATETRLNFRQGPGKDRPVITVMPAYSIVKISDLVVDGYRYIAYNGTTGWAYNSYLVTGYEVVSTRKLAIRAEPRSTAAYLGALPAWASATAFIGENGYSLILYDGKVGWVLQRYLS